MAILNKIINFAKNIDIKKSQQAEELLTLKGNNIVSSFKNIWSYTDKKIAEKEILKLEKKVNKRIAKGKKVSPNLKKQLENENYRKIEKFKNDFIMTSILGCCINQEDIQNANNDLGSFAMLEEIAKTALMFNSFRFTFIYGKKLINNSIMTGAIYKPDKTKNLLYLKSPLTTASIMSASFQMKPALDSLWETEYEKSLENPK